MAEVSLELIGLMHDPELLVLDEPFAGLDPGGVDDMTEILAERARAGVTVVFSNHQLDLVEHICESVAIIHRGRVVAQGAVSDLERGDRVRLAVRVAAMTEVVREAGRLTGTGVTVVPQPSLASAEGALRSGRLDVVLANDSEVVVKQVSVTDSSGADRHAGAVRGGRRTRLAGGGLRRTGRGGHGVDGAHRGDHLRSVHPAYRLPGPVASGAHLPRRSRLSGPAAQPPRQHGEAA